MYKDLLKISLDVLDNPKKNEDNMRVYRDKSTDQFATVMFSDKDKMYQYLDYTFHTIYSYLITKINRELILQSIKNPEMNIKPLCGDESVIFVFKGGSVMHILYNTFLNSLRDQIPNVSSDDLVKYFINIKNNNILNYMGINSDNYRYNQSVDNLDKRNKMRFQFDVENSSMLENKSDNIKDFMDSILKPKFGISDIDYSIYINTDTNSRYLLIHGIVVKLLHVILDYITKKFDVHLNNILSGNTKIDKPLNYLESNEIINVYDHPYYTILKSLKMIMCQESLKKDLQNYDGYSIPSYFNFNLQYYNRFDDINLRDRLLYVLNIFNQSMINNKLEQSMYILYFMLEIVFYCDYLDQINNKFLNHNLNLEDIRTHIVHNITILIDSKEYDLMSMPYYNVSELNTIKKNLAKNFSSLSPDANELKTKISIKSGKSEPDTYKLINHRTITENDFDFRPTVCFDLVANQQMPTEMEISERKCNKIHYVTYNSIIRLERGPTVIDFDLIRSKINLVMKGKHFIKNNQIVDIMPVPSEFIDISISRFDDTSRLSFLKEIRKTSGLPYLLHLKTSSGKNISINSYGPDNITHDLLYILFSQNTFEPWLDKKFQKRIIRSIYFVVLNRALKTKISNDRSYMDNFLTFIEFCISIKNSMQNPNDTTYWNFVEKMAMSKNNITKQESTNIMKFYIKYLEFKTRQSVEVFTNYLILDLIADEYSDVSEIIISFLFWASIMNKNNTDIKDYMNIERDIYKWVPLEPKTDFELNLLVTDIKNNVHKLIDTIINVGVKVFYLYSMFINSGTMPSIQGGNQIDYSKKYLKYKNKYMNAKKQHFH